MAVRILHFADAHIDIANYGRYDPETGLPQRVVDFLNALDQIVDTAVDEQVDLVLFAGDAYKDRNPQPTFQKAWGERIMRLAKAGIPTVLLVGNHDMAPSEFRAHTLQEFRTLAVPHVHVADRLQLLTPDVLGVPLQIITIPWLSRSRLLNREEMAGKSSDQLVEEIGNRLHEALDHMMDEVDPALPLVLAAHANVLGATFGSERQIMLGQELTLTGSVVADPRIDYVALGHIHKHQSLGEHPPVVYPGSIERIDFGEANEKKGFVLAEIERGGASWRFVPLKTRPFVDLRIEARDPERFMDEIMDRLPPAERLRDAICRVVLEYPQDLESLLDEKRILDHFSEAFDVRLAKHRLVTDRSRLAAELIESLGPYELLTAYWRSKGMDEGEIEALSALARDVLAGEIAGDGRALDAP